MSRSFASLLSLSALVACAPEAAEHEQLEHAEVAEKGGTKVDVCHLTGSGSINVLNVSTSAVSAHLAHGDHLAGSYFLDADGDGEGDAGDVAECLYENYVDNDDDCDDGDDTVNTDAEEICGDDIDNNCDGQVDEDCTVEVTLTVNGDNGVWAWIDGEPVTFDYNFPHWQVARTATVEVDSSDDHAVAFYVEDWGGLAYFTASVEVDGVLEAATGAGDFVSTGGVSSSYINEWPRIAAWDNTPDDSGDWPNLIFSPGTTWGDWMQVGFDDSSWSADTNTCAYPTYWNTSWLAGTYGGAFNDLAANGAQTVWHDFGYYPSGTCYSAGDSGTAWRMEF
jgi:hypothetical protein